MARTEIARARRLIRKYKRLQMVMAGLTGKRLTLRQVYALEDQLNDLSDEIEGLDDRLAFEQNVTAYNTGFREVDPAKLAAIVVP
jgi:hypothetical protein